MPGRWWSTVRRAVTTAARRADPHDVAGGQGHGALVRKPLGPGFVAAGQQPGLPHGTRAAAGQAPRPGSPALTDQRQRHRLEDLEVALGAVGPPPAPHAPPAPPPPARSRSRRTRSGKARSRASIGVFLVLVMAVWTPLIPPRPGRPPCPPAS